ncbi:MAG TPA: hypothetical protein VIP46_09340 [Pyrinomonadaceae bacterium]
MPNVWATWKAFGQSRAESNPYCGKKLKCGKSCTNFRRAEALPLEAIGEIAGANGAADYVEKVRGVMSGK